MKIYEGWIQNSITDNFAIRFAMKDRKRRRLSREFIREYPAVVYTQCADYGRANLALKRQVGSVSEKTMVDIKYLESDYVRVGGTSTMHQFRDPGLNPAGIPASNAAMYAMMGIVFPTFVIAQGISSAMPSLLAVTCLMVRWLRRTQRA